jgi:hypothetical protein
MAKDREPQTPKTREDHEREKREAGLEKAETSTMEPGVRVNPDPNKDTPEDRKPTDKA